jgi:hypothetical protein
VTLVLAAHACDTTGTPPTIRIAYATPLEQQEVNIGRNPPCIRSFVGEVNWRYEDAGQACIATLYGEDTNMFVRVQSWSEEHPPQHPEADRLTGKRVRVTVEEI